MKYFKYLALLSLIAVGTYLNVDNPLLQQRSEHNISQKKLPAQSHPQRTPAQEKEKYGRMDPKLAMVYDAIDANPPHGRSWEFLPEDEFIEDVEEWTDEILMAANLEIHDPKAKMVGNTLFLHSDPYLQYLGFALLYRSGHEGTTDMISTFLMLKNHALTHNLYVEDLETATHEHKVRHTLVRSGIIEGYGGRLMRNIHNDTPAEYWEKVQIEIREKLDATSDPYARHMLITVTEQIY